jgi:hypothetical protein
LHHHLFFSSFSSSLLPISSNLSFFSLARASLFLHLHLSSLQGSAVAERDGRRRGIDAGGSELTAGLAAQVMRTGGGLGTG